jgi:hypothetical protein
MRNRILLQSESAGLKCIFALFLILALCPGLLISFPAMVDYPNHLARMFILSRDGTPAENPFYQVNWAVYPNLAMDLIVPRLARVMSVEAATRSFYVFSQILIVSGALAIEYAVKGRFHVAGIVAVMFLYSLPFAWGFVNFEFGMGVALWGIAIALIAQEQRRAVRLAAHSAFVALLFVAHFFALGIYGVTIGIHELWRAWSRRAPLTETFARMTILALPALAVVALMIFSGGSIGGSGTKWFFEYKPLWLFHIMNGYNLPLSTLSVLILLGLVYILAKRGALRIERAGIWLATGFAILYVLMPSKLLDTSFVDLRVVVAAALILPAFVSVSFPNPRWKLGVAFCVVFIVSANVALVFLVWNSYRAEYQAMIESFTKIQKGSLVLIGHSGEADDPPLGNLDEYPIYHAPVLAVAYADAFVPTFFTAPGKQPVVVRSAYQHLALPYGGPAPIGILKAIAEKKIPADTPVFVRNWFRDFDFLYVVGPHVPNAMPNLLDEVYAGSRFVLYRIRKQT